LKRSTFLLFLFFSSQTEVASFFFFFFVFFVFFFFFCINQIGEDETPASQAGWGDALDGMDSGTEENEEGTPKKAPKTKKEKLGAVRVETNFDDD
jgi:hypothetical protein